MTSLEWLVEQMIYQMDIRIENTTIGCELLEQAKEMEKQQMFDYVKANYVNGENSLKFHQEEFEKYYNEKFKSN